MLINKFYNNINIDDKKLVNKLIIETKEHYEDKWKSINKLDTSIAIPIRLSLESKNIELSKKLEKELMAFDLISDYRIEKFNNKEIIYKIIFNSSPDKFLENMLSLNFNIDTSNDVWKLR